MELDTKPITNGWDAQAKPIIVGYAPLAPRPDWLPKTGPGQKNVDPLKWSLSVEQWIFFVRLCVATVTWKKLAEVKGEYNITMYDINDHFVKPWTQGTGCSIALLMNTAEQLPIEGMFSHAWAGSVVPPELQTNWGQLEQLFLKGVPILGSSSVPNLRA